MIKRWKKTEQMPNFYKYVSASDSSTWERRNKCLNVISLGVKLTVLTIIKMFLCYFWVVYFSVRLLFFSLLRYNLQISSSCCTYKQNVRSPRAMSVCHVTSTCGWRTDSLLDRLMFGVVLLIIWKSELGALNNGKDSFCLSVVRTKSIRESSDPWWLMFSF